MNSTFTRYLYFLSILLILAAMPGAAQAQDDREKIDADRADQSQGPGVVPRRTVQFEAGYFYQKQSQQVKTLAYPTALLRIGLLGGIELRVQGALKDSVVENRTDGDPVPSYAANITRELTNKLTLYVETFGSKQKRQPAEHQGDLGLLYLLLPNLQLDMAAGTRLNKATPRSFRTGGLAVRLPR